MMRSKTSSYLGSDNYFFTKILKVPYIVGWIFDTIEINLVFLISKCLYISQIHTNVGVQSNIQGDSCPEQYES